MENYSSDLKELVEGVESKYNYLKDIFDEVIQEVQGADIKITIGAVTIFVTFVVECILLSKGIIFKNYDRKKIAKERGHVIVAERIPRGNRRPDEDGYYSESYIYYVDGKKKKYSIAKQYQLPETLELYYLNTPKKVFSEYDSVSASIILIYIIPLLAGGAVINILDMFGL